MYPWFLYRCFRPKLQRDKILSSHSFFVRHKVIHEAWDEDEEVPKFEDIKITGNQSMNWSFLSIPHWVRYDDKQNLKNEYAVVSYDSRLFLDFQIIADENIDMEEGDTINGNWIDVKHDPICINYSHCEMKCVSDVKGKSKRARRYRRYIREAMRLFSTTIYKPHDIPSTEESKQQFRLMINEYVCGKQA